MRKLGPRLSPETKERGTEEESKKQEEKNLERGNPGRREPGEGQPCTEGTWEMGLLVKGGTELL